MERRLVEMISEALSVVTSSRCNIRDLTICPRGGTSSLSICIRAGKCEGIYDEVVVEIKQDNTRYVRHFDEQNYKRLGWYLGYRFFRYIADTLEDLGFNDPMFTSMGWYWDKDTMNALERHYRFYRNALLMEAEPLDIMKFEEPEGEEDQ